MSPARKCDPVTQMFHKKLTHPRLVPRVCSEGSMKDRHIESMQRTCVALIRRRPWLSDTVLGHPIVVFDSHGTFGLKGKKRGA